MQLDWLKLYFFTYGDFMSFDSTKYTGLDHGYLDYTYILDNFDEVDIEKKTTKIKPLFAKQTKEWTDQLNTEWSARLYLSMKFILSTNLLASSLEYSINKNLQTVVPYLSYYSLLTACRSYIMTLPNESWNDGAILGHTHDKTINIVTDSLRTINKGVAEEFNEKICKLKAIRELFSYKFPSTGIDCVEDKTILHLDDTLNYCGLLCELAQLNSEFLEASFIKHTKGKSFSIIEDVLWEIIQYEDESSGIFFVDDNDWRRVEQWTRNPEPFNIICATREGLVDDFFASWEIYSESPDDFIPNPRIVFSLP